jgi:hypothetical protein
MKKSNLPSYKRGVLHVIFIDTKNLVILCSFDFWFLVSIITFLPRSELKYILLLYPPPPSPPLKALKCEIVVFYLKKLFDV